jgi:hypothetical protein
MTDDEWEGVAFFLEEWWRGEFDDRKRRAYRVALDKFSPEQVMAALHALVETGKPFLPSVPEIVAKLRSVEESPVPGWSEVYRWIVRAQHKAGQKYTAPDQEKTAAGAEFLREKCHPVVAAFYEAEGYARLSRIEFGDEEYGELRIKDLRERFEEFVDVARARRVCLAVYLLIVCVVCWPGTHLLILVTKPNELNTWVGHLLLAISWLAILVTALDLILTADVRAKEEESA